MSASSSSNSRPWAVRALNGVGHHLLRDGERVFPLDMERLIASAERSTGLCDWGKEDFRPALARLLDAFNSEARLNTMGRAMLNSGMQRFLCNRLRMERDWTLHPEILQAPINRPIFIIGLPRTGSTLAQRMLSADPDARALYTWEMMEPALAKVGQKHDRRKQTAANRLKVLEWAAPEFMVAHEVKPDEPEECVTLLQNGFVTDTFELMGSIPGYRDWVATQDLEPTYRYYRKQLQLLQAQRSAGHWVLKSPFHQLGLDSILKLFPDALIVQTHRDPIKVVPSWCSLFSAMHELTSDHADRHDIGRQRLQRLAETSRHVIEVRKSADPQRFVDISFNELMADPLAAMAKIHERAGLPLSATARSAMSGWLARNQQHKRGVHQYTLDTFGLSAEQVNHELAHYRERFAEYM